MFGVNRPSLLPKLSPACGVRGKPARLLTRAQKFVDLLLIGSWIMLLNSSVANGFLLIRVAATYGFRLRMAAWKNSTLTPRWGKVLDIVCCMVEWINLSIMEPQRLRQEFLCPGESCIGHSRKIFLEIYDILLLLKSFNEWFVYPALERINQPCRSTNAHFSVDSDCTIAAQRY